MPAAGWAKTLEQVELLAQVPVITEITIGSFTVEARAENSGNIFGQIDEGGSSLNSLGLPNGGIKYLRRILRKMIDVAHGSGKKLRLSVAGFTLPEFVELAQIANEFHVDALELNFGCPNVWKDGKQKVITAFSPNLIEVTIAEIMKRINKRIEIAVKLSPYSNPATLNEVAHVITKIQQPITVVTSNTFPNALAFNDSGSQLISVGEGLAGLSGNAMKPIALGQVKQFRKLLPDMCPILGVSGISSGKDARDFLIAGASGIQIGTAFFSDENPRIFENIVSELADLP